MGFEIGINEVILVALLGIVTTLLATLHQPAWRWGAVLTACASVSTVVTPADPLSSIVLGLLFFAFFVVGTQFRKPNCVAVQ